MIFLKQYLKLISFSLMTLVFMFSSFYLFANLYHYFEIRKDFYTNFDTQSLVLNLDEKLGKIQENISSYDANTYAGSVPTNQMTLVSQNLNQCVTYFKNDYLNSMRGKNKISIVDVYNLRETYENEILNGCIINNLYWTTNPNFSSDFLNNNKDLSKMYIDSLLSRTSYLKKDLINNSSYYYNTSVSSTSVKDNTRDGFYEVMEAYNEAADYLLYVSNWFRTEVGR